MSVPDLRAGDEHARCDRCGRHIAQDPRGRRGLWSMTVDDGAVLAWRCPRCQPAGAPAEVAHDRRTPLADAYLLAPATFRAVCDRGLRIGGLAPSAAVLQADGDRAHVFVSAYVNPDGHHLGGAFALRGPPPPDGVVGAQELLGAPDARGLYLEALAGHLQDCPPLTLREPSLARLVREGTRRFMATTGLQLPP